MTDYFATHPAFLVLAGVVFVMLLALTMRSVIRRDKAMINTGTDEPQRVESYIQRWRGAA